MVHRSNPLCAPLPLVATLAFAQLHRPVDDEVTAEPLCSGERVELRSDVLDETRTIRVWLPPSYERTTRGYPVLYVLDGEGAAFEVTSAAVRFLSGVGMCPEMIVVAIHNSRRERDMTPRQMNITHILPESRGADRFLEFFASELFPLVESRYRTKPFRVLVGHSHGGILGAYALAARPELFRWHLGIDAPAHLDDAYLGRALGAFLAEHPTHRGRLVSAERKFGWPDGAWEQVASNAPAGFFLDRFELEDESHESMVFEATYEGLKRLFHDYPRDELDAKRIADLEQENAELSLRYGYPVEMSRRALLIHADELMLQGFGADARALLERATHAYGRFPGLEERLARAQKIERSGPPEETVADVSALPRASIEAMKPFLGRWVGVVGEAKMSVTFSVEGGQVVGSTQFVHPDGKLGLVLEHVVILAPDEKTVEWGYINNMRPRGVLFYSATLGADGALTGRMRMRGAKLSLPPGMDPEAVTPRFEFRRE